MKKAIVLFTAAAMSFMVSCSDDDSATNGGKITGP